jgi:hypothetical protein
VRLGQLACVGEESLGFREHSHTRFKTSSLWGEFCLLPQ